MSDPNYFFGDPAERDEDPAPIADVLAGLMFVILVGWIVMILHFLPYSTFCKG